MDFYHEDCDLHSASAEYAKRFSGPAGRWMLALQSRIVLRMLKEHPTVAVLDVGGGHGQISVPAAQQGYKITCLGSSAEAFNQVQAVAGGEGVLTRVGELLDIPFEAKSFEVVTCFRILAHCRGWQRLVGEMCRVSRSDVIVDYPLSRSVNALTPLLFGAKKGIEKNTRDYALFSEAEVDHQFREHGFERASATKQFFFPMVVHRMLGAPALSSLIEIIPRVLGLTSLLGSPIIACYRKRAG